LVNASSNGDEWENPDYFVSQEEALSLIVDFDSRKNEGRRSK